MNKQELKEELEALRLKFGNITVQEAINQIQAEVQQEYLNSN